MEVKEGLAFDDVLLVPKYSDVQSRKDVDISTNLAPQIKLKIPLASSNMETVTEARMAIAMARLGGIGFLHRFMTIQDQVSEVIKVKRAEAVVIEQPHTLTPSNTLREAREMMQLQGVHGIPIIDSAGKLAGLLTYRDVQFENDVSKPIELCMTPRRDLVVAELGINIESAKDFLKKNKIEKLPLVDKDDHLRGLITAKDIISREHHPDATKDRKGRLIVGAAIGVKGDYLERVGALVNAGCDLILIDIAHGHSSLSIQTLKQTKDRFPEIPVVAGNVATPDGTRELIKAGADCVKVGVGSGSICVTRIVTGAGYPQLSAVLDCAKVARDYGIPVMSDGGMGGKPGNLTKALAAGASVVMKGRSLAGTDESPSPTMIKDGTKYKIYRGSASFGANIARNERMNQEIEIDYNPEGVEAMVHYAGSVADVIKQYLAGLRSGMSYVGAHSIRELWERAEFVKLTDAGKKESGVHGVEQV